MKLKYLKVVVTDTLNVAPIATKHKISKPLAIT